MEDYMVKLFKSLGHPVRLKIVKKLGRERLCVCELQEDVEFSQSNLSQHLKILRDSGVLSGEKEGLKVMYQVKDFRVLDMLDMAEGIVGTYLKRAIEGR